MTELTKGLLTALVAALLAGCATGVLGLGGSSWREEVLLNDGRTIIAERNQSYGGKPTLDSRERAVLDEEWTFPTPDGKGKVVWHNNFRNPPEGNSLMLLLAGFIDGVPYIATRAAGCIAYNHWGRPNPPYIFFRYDGKQWQRITLAEFPAQLKDTNVIVGRPNPRNRSGTIAVAAVKEDNKGLDFHYRSIVREPLPTGSSGTSCDELELYRGHWIQKDSMAGRYVVDGIIDRKSKQQD